MMQALHPKVAHATNTTRSKNNNSNHNKRTRHHPTTTTTTVASRQDGPAHTGTGTGSNRTLLSMFKRRKPNHGPSVTTTNAHDANTNTSDDSTKKLLPNGTEMTTPPPTVAAATATPPPPPPPPTATTATTATPTAATHLDRTTTNQEMDCVMLVGDGKDGEKQKKHVIPVVASDQNIPTSLQAVLKDITKLQQLPDQTTIYQVLLETITALSTKTIGAEKTAALLQEQAAAAAARAAAPGAVTGHNRTTTREPSSMSTTNTVAKAATQGSEPHAPQVQLVARTTTTVVNAIRKGPEAVAGPTQQSVPKYEQRSGAAAGGGGAAAAGPLLCTIKDVALQIPKMACVMDVCANSLCLRHPSSKQKDKTLWFEFNKDILSHALLPHANKRDALLTLQLRVPLVKGKQVHRWIALRIAGRKEAFDDSFMATELLDDCAEGPIVDTLRQFVTEEARKTDARNMAEEREARSDPAAAHSAVAQLSKLLKTTSQLVFEIVSVFSSKETEQHEKCFGFNYLNRSEGLDSCPRALPITGHIGSRDVVAYLLPEGIFLATNLMQHIPMRGVKAVAAARGCAGTSRSFDTVINFVDERGSKKEVAIGMIPRDFQTPMAQYFDYVSRRNDQQEVNGDSSSSGEDSSEEEEEEEGEEEDEEHGGDDGDESAVDMNDDSDGEAFEADGSSSSDESGSGGGSSDGDDDDYDEDSHACSGDEMFVDACDTATLESTRARRSAAQ